jgi:trehalose 6-phosphate synthase
MPERGVQAGGLAVALREALTDRHGIWFGWSGKVGPPGPPKTVNKDGISYVTVDLKKDDHQEFYNGFANGVLWPILHYRLDLVEFTRRDLGGYLRVNDYFAPSLERIL